MVVRELTAAQTLPELQALTMGEALHLLRQMQKLGVMGLAEALMGPGCHCCPAAESQEVAADLAQTLPAPAQHSGGEYKLCCRFCSWQAT